MGEVKSTARYADDKPTECQKCFWWDCKEKKCKLGEENCYYLVPNDRPKKKKSPCEGCPYGKTNPCIGFCMRKLLQN